MGKIYHLPNGNSETKGLNYPTERIRDIAKLVDSGEIWKANQLALDAFRENVILTERIEPTSYSQYIVERANNFSVALPDYVVGNVIQMLEEGRVTEARKIIPRLIRQNFGAISEHLEEVVQSHYEQLQKIKEPAALKLLSFDIINLAFPWRGILSNCGDVSGITTDGKQIYVAVSGDFPDKEGMSRIISFLPDGTDKRVHLEEILDWHEEKGTYCKNLFYHNGGLYFLRREYNKNYFLRRNVDDELPKFERGSCFSELDRARVFKHLPVPASAIPHARIHNLQYDGKIAYMVLHLNNGRDSIYCVDLDSRELDLVLDLPFETKHGLSFKLQEDFEGIGEYFRLGDITNLAIDDSWLYVFLSEGYATTPLRVDKEKLKLGERSIDKIKPIGIFKCSDLRLSKVQNQRLYLSGFGFDFDSTNLHKDSKSREGMFSIDLNDALDKGKLVPSKHLSIPPNSMSSLNGGLYLGFNGFGSVIKLRDTSY